MKRALLLTICAGAILLLAFILYWETDTQAVSGWNGWRSTTLEEGDSRNKGEEFASVAGEKQKLAFNEHTQG